MNLRPLPMLLAAVFCAAHASAQLANVLDTDLDRWVVTANSTEVQTVRSSGQIVFTEGPQFANRAAVRVSTKFSVPKAGTYLLQPNCEASVFGSPVQSTWSIPGVGSGAWRQTYFRARYVPQWVVNLKASTSYDFVISSYVDSGGRGTVRVRPSLLHAVELPVMIPGQCYQDQGEATFDLTVATSSTFKQPVYMLYAGASIHAPVSLPFGSLWLAQPQLALVLNTPSWRPSTQSEAWAGYYAATRGTYWQVLEFDMAQVAATLRLGSVTQTLRR